MENKSDFKKVAKRERLFSTLARKEGKSNQELAQKAKGPNKKDLEWESWVDMLFSKIREKKAKKAEEKSMA